MSRVFGRFVPTAMWVGASLYDGIGPQANGESDMEVRRRARRPGPGRGRAGRGLPRAVGLVRAVEPGAGPGAGGRSSSPGSGAPGPTPVSLKSPGRGPGLEPWSRSRSICLIGVGIWGRRRDPRALALLAGPLVYFCLLHMVFVSSIRYRIPGEVPALGLAAALGSAGWRDGGRPMRDDQVSRDAPATSPSASLRLWAEVRGLGTTLDVRRSPFLRSPAMRRPSPPAPLPGGEGRKMGAGRCSRVMRGPSRGPGATGRGGLHR